MVKITEEKSKMIQKIIVKMQCPKNLKCAESGFKHLCRARVLGDKSLQCLEETNPPCLFAGIYDDVFQMRFCRCPLRVYIAMHLELDSRAGAMNRTAVSPVRDTSLQDS